MARKRNYKAEYARRISRGLKKGLSRAQARGHGPAKRKRSASKAKAATSEKRLERAIKALQKGKSQKAAAKLAKVSPERLRRFVYDNKIGRWQGRKWVMSDNRPRRVPTIYRGQQRTVIVPGFAEASLAGHYHNAVGQFIRSNDLEHLKSFRDQGLTDTKGRFFEFETDPNALHRYAAADNIPFHEIYQIISN